MHIIRDCPRCGNDFMHHSSDVHLHRELSENEKLREEYPIQDNVWESRRWNTERTEYVDLSGGYEVICQDCGEKEKKEAELAV